MPILSFNKELQYNILNLDREYCIDVSRETIQLLKSYERRSQSFLVHDKDRYATTTRTSGTVNADLTIGNPGWPVIFGSCLGQVTELQGFSFDTSDLHAHKTLVGTLEGDISSITQQTFNINSIDKFSKNNLVIINDEVINITGITDNQVNSCDRAQEGTQARLHSSQDLVWGIKEAPSTAILMCHRAKPDYFYVLPDSLTLCIDRQDGKLYTYSGMLIESLLTNFIAGEYVQAEIGFKGADTTSLIEFIDVSIQDNYPLASGLDTHVFSNIPEERFQRFYIALSNTLHRNVNMYTGMTNKFILMKTATYGTFNWAEDVSDYLEQYIQNTKRSFGLISGINNNKIIFSINDVRINTPSYYLDSSLEISDYLPWYSFEHPVIFFQTGS